MQPFWIGLAALALVAAPAQAEPESDPAAADRKVDQMIETSKQVYGEQRATSTCAKANADEIVVCLDRPKDQRVPSTAQTDPNSLAARRALDGNIPSAPRFDHGSCKGKPGCITGGWAPPPAYYVDVSALPQAPEGSEADKISKGEVSAP